jgi:Fe-S-cluster-containing hydrogenase component 2
MPRPVEAVSSNYQAKIDPELCSACGLCMERCQMAAIKEGKDSYEIAEEKCIGCGLCVSVCPTGALSMAAKPKVQAPPTDFFRDTLQRIQGERHAILDAKGAKKSP